MNTKRYIIVRIKDEIDNLIMLGHHPVYIFLGKEEMKELRKWTSINLSLIFKNPAFEGIRLDKKSLFGYDLIEVDKDHFLYVA